MANPTWNETKPTEIKKNTTLPSWTETTELEEVGDLEAGLKGAAQGLTFGFSDEIIAAAKSAFGDETYEQELKKAREELDRLDDESVAYQVGKGAGELASFALPGAAALKVAKKAPTLAKIIDKTASGLKKGTEMVGKTAMVAGAVANPKVGIPLAIARQLHKNKKSGSMLGELKDLLKKKEK